MEDLNKYLIEVLSSSASLTMKNYLVMGINLNQAYNKEWIICKTSCVVGIS